MSRAWSAAELAKLVGVAPPTDEQRAAIQAPLAPCLVVAGAGSGKTATMAGRVLWLVANRLVRPDQVLGLTFTKKAAGELADRIRGQLGRMLGHLAADRPELRDDPFYAGSPTVLTYHSYAARLYTEHALRDGREPSTRLLTEAVSWQYAAQVVERYSGPMDQVEWLPASVIDALRSLAGELAEHLREPAEVLALTRGLDAAIRALPRAAKQSTRNDDFFAETRKLLAALARREQLLPLVEAYTDLKRHRDAMDFGDQVALAARLATRHPVIGRTERDRFSVVLLDEYQDTAHGQRELLRSLYSGGHPVTAVGDPFQSIYGWRGASEQNLSAFPDDFRLADGTPSRILGLTTSFRNGGRILAVANTLAVPLREAALVPVAPLRSTPARTDEGDVVWALHETAADEAAWVADRIAALVLPAKGAAEAPYEPADVAVLVRVRTQIDRLQQALLARGVPVEVIGVGGLLATPEVRDVVATLRVLVDPSAGSAVVRLLTGPRWRLGPRDLAALGRRARRLVLGNGTATETVVDSLRVEPDSGPDETETRSLVDALDDPGQPGAYSPDGYRRIVSLRDELRALRQRADQSLADLIADIIRTIGLDVELAAQPDGATATGLSPAAARRHLDRLLEVADAFVADQVGDERVGETATVPAFLGYLHAAELQERGLETDPGEAAHDAVSLLTMHGAKGLEWPVVVLPGMSKGVFPNKGIASTSWVGNAALVPFELRGDRAALPDIQIGLCTDQRDVRQALIEHDLACRDRDLLEERRLLYVAATRPRSVLICSGYWWGDGSTMRAPSEFLLALRRAAQDRGIGEEACWTPEPEDGTPNPMLGEPLSAAWPYDPLGARRAETEAAAGLVAAAVDHSATDAAGVVRVGADEGGPAGRWFRETELLLAERAAGGRASATDVVLPGRLSVSDLVALRRDPGGLARRIRRPVPYKPAPLARRGTAFHSWVESRFGVRPLVDVDQLPGSADDGAAGDDELAMLKERFLASEWGARQPLEVEVAFETRVGGVLVRGRIDAVFHDDGGYDIVDWKTGAPPSGAEVDAVAVQLAAYRLAWAALSGVPLDDVRASFHYVRTGTTVRPVDLLDAAGLVALVESLPLSC